MTDEDSFKLIVYDGNEGVSPPRPHWGVATENYFNPVDDDAFCISATIECGDRSVAEMFAASYAMFDALLKVEEWWLQTGMHEHIGAPYCMFNVRALLDRIKKDTGYHDEVN